MTVIDIPEPLHEFIANGGDPREILGDGFSDLIAALVNAGWLTAEQCEQRAAVEMWSAIEYANGREVVPFGTPPLRSVEHLRALVALDRWSHDILTDDRSRAAMLAILDRFELEMYETDLDHARRPAPLGPHTSSGQSCDSCGEHVDAGAPMLTFEVQGDPHPDDPWAWCLRCVHDASTSREAAAADAKSDDQLITRYLDNLRLRSMSPRTVDRRRNTLDLFRAATNRPLRDIDVDDIESFLASKRTPATRRAYLSDLSSFYGWATKRGHLEHDPTTAVDRPKVPPRAPTPINATDVDRLLAAVEPGSATERIVYLGLFAGLRASEIARLHTDDVDFDANVIVIRSGKGGGDAVLPMAPQLAEVLRYRPRGPVVGLTRRHDVSARVKQLFRKLGIDARTHDLRHTFGTSAARASNGNVIAVRDLMRHSSVGTTQAYIGWAPDTAGLVASLHQPPSAAPTAAV
jgi:integrase/recombinase XerC